MKKTKKGIAKKLPVELTVKCPRCKSKAGRRCVNTKTGVVKKIAHDARVALATGNAPVSVTNPVVKKVVHTMTDEQKKIGKMLEAKIKEILGETKAATFVAPVTSGPVITTYRFQPMRRCRVNHLEALSKDFAVLLGAESVLVKRMPGETNVGVFVPRADRQIINFRDTVQHVVAKAKEKTEDGHKILPINLGQDSDGNPFVDDLTIQPHLLIAGTTGGGKSTLLHGIATSLAYAMPPEDLKLIISDTKGVEFTHFAALPHLLFPIATTVFETMQALQWAQKETQTRLNQIATLGVRNIHEYNRVAPTKMPYIVIVIDELADLMGRHVDKDIAKAASAQLQEIVGRSRASGIHVIAGTQRPDVKTVAGAIKANFPSRLSFRLPSQQDSRTVINTKGAENLMSRGDMLYSSSVSPELKRLHAPYTSIEDIKVAVQYIVAKSKTSDPLAQHLANASGTSSRVQ